MTRWSVPIAMLTMLLTSGCAPHAILRDPNTGQTVNCTLQAMQADKNPIGQIVEERRCASGFKAAGFVCLQGNC